MVNTQITSPHLQFCFTDTTFGSETYNSLTPFMMRSIKHITILILTTVVSLITKADSWLEPTTQTYFSDNKQYMLVVKPAVVPLKYTAWKYYSKQTTTTNKRKLRKKQRFLQTITANDTTLIPCMAELYKVSNTDTLLIWEKQLLNEVCPIIAIIANDGSSVATIDNWYSHGYGTNVFVVYDAKGEAKRTYQLNDFSPFPLNEYLTSVSSMHWCGGATYIHPLKISLTCINQQKQFRSIIYDVQLMKWIETKE